MSFKNIIEQGANVITTEAEALNLLAKSLDENFAKAVETILNCEGRVILSGMGKSGHIGRKIAATLASTGTPSFFVHPAEASHGDLGMITPNDICIVLSNSGETSELSDVLAHCKRFGIAIIGVASKAESTLIQSSNIGLVLPAAKEACAIGMAPTTSTTMTLALGDALAVAVMELRGFKKENFKTFHPGGKLGAALLKVTNLMHKGSDLPLVPQGTSMKDAILEMSAKTFGVVGVLDNDFHLAGIITDGDLRRNIDDLLSKDVDKVANPKPIVVKENMLALEAVHMMNERKITCLFVVSEDNKPVGLVRLHDCLRAGVE